MVDNRAISLAGILALAVFTACGGLDKEAAELEIRERLCDEWSYGCTESTEVAVQKVRKTRLGRQVEFRVVDRADATPTLAAAYFEPKDDGWEFILFEDPFRTLLDQNASLLTQDRKLFTDQLMDVKAAQRWFIAIYGRYATSLAELDSVSYKVQGGGLSMISDDRGGSWQAEVASDFVRCEMDNSRQLPHCRALPAEGAGTETGPLTRAFGTQ